MFPDELDIFLLSEMHNSYSKELVNDWEMSKVFFCKTKNLPTDNLEFIYKNNQREIDNLYRKIVSRLKSYCIKGICWACENGDGRTSFKVDLDKVTFIKNKFSDGYKKCIVIRIDPMTKKV